MCYVLPVKDPSFVQEEHCKTDLCQVKSGRQKRHYCNVLATDKAHNVFNLFLIRIHGTCSVFPVEKKGCTNKQNKFTLKKRK